VFARVVADALQVLGVPPENDPQSLLAGDFQVYDTAHFSAENQPARADEPSIRVRRLTSPLKRERRFCI